MARGDVRETASPGNKSRRVPRRMLRGLSMRARLDRDLVERTALGGVRCL
ncbi:hypothetical protein [Haematobacter missouriensis]|nr:hypothetical protein [Haematobacter missouriensis]